jgi:hypothetical protein
MSGCLRNLAEVTRRIERGDTLLLAADAHLLRSLPVGNWIGGSIPYFMAEDGPTSTRDMIHVTELPACVSDVSIRTYDSASISNVYADISDRDFGIIVMPASSATHFEFALHAPTYPDFAVRPLVGWISGVNLNDPGDLRASVFCGTTGTVVENGAVVMQVSLLPGFAADVKVLNIFEQGAGESISFAEDGFDVETAIIDGVKTNLADYIQNRGLDTRLPLVADYYGVMVNVSFQAVDAVNRAVRFYAPVFAGPTYRHARPVEDYSKKFASQMPTNSPDETVFSCNCILNYFYSGMDGKHMPGDAGPLTFGEVAYQLLNQTMVYLTISDLSRQAPG